ncbi:hypothetical protein [Bdellovibrio sp. NC01]|uniref:hypothetical protein n=1 Tax=Bdellovibrio sp. NC01 TaxID=2220073 RepID=UPI00115AA14E|nr:hypothetical protein [Bdellovibrio sp. NC01]QDK37918.1 hypothetical protein DOE51_10145 [Bdellovibrio sp. NC01]
MKYLYLILFAAIVFISIENIAFARDAVEMGTSAQAYFLRIGIATVGIGITIAGILYSIGLGQWGRILLINGGIGATIILGMAAILKIFSSITGSSL